MAEHRSGVMLDRGLRSYEIGECKWHQDDDDMSTSMSMSWVLI